jgi:acyl-CoA thioesterase FadM
MTGPGFRAMNVYSRFETELAVRPDDIDLYQHVHSTRYLDYVLAARFDQMERCYRMPMQAFAAMGLGWFLSAATIQFKRPLGWGDRDGAHLDRAFYGDGLPRGVRD